jgi:hypothetical protein
MQIGNLRSIACAPLLLILATLLVSSCSSVKQIEIASVPVERVPLNLPGVDPLVLEEIKWYVVIEKNFKAVMAELEKKGYETVIFGLTDKGYEILALNIAKIKQLTMQQEAKIKAYEAYYKKQNDKLEEMNAKQEGLIKDAEAKNKASEGKGLLDGVTNLFGGNKKK